MNLVRITWNYGGREVYIIGSFTNWEYMVKMSKRMIGELPVFEISMVRFMKLHIKDILTHTFTIVCERRILQVLLCG